MGFLLFRGVAFAGAAVAEWDGLPGVIGGGPAVGGIPQTSQYPSTMVPEQPG